MQINSYLDFEGKQNNTDMVISVCVSGGTGSDENVYFNCHGLIDSLASCRTSISGLLPFTYLVRVPMANGHNWHFLVASNSIHMP